MRRSLGWRAKPPVVWSRGAAAVEILASGVSVLLLLSVGWTSAQDIARSTRRKERDDVLQRMEQSLKNQFAREKRFTSSDSSRVQAQTGDGFFELSPNPGCRPDSGDCGFDKSRGHWITLENMPSEKVQFNYWGAGYFVTTRVVDGKPQYYAAMRVGAYPIQPDPRVLPCGRYWEFGVGGGGEFGNQQWQLVADTCLGR